MLQDGACVGLLYFMFPALYRFLKHTPFAESIFRRLADVFHLVFSTAFQASDNTTQHIVS